MICSSQSRKLSPVGDRHLFVFNINNGKFLWDRLLLISVALLDGEDKKFVVVSSQNSKFYNLPPKVYSKGQNSVWTTGSKQSSSKNVFHKFIWLLEKI